MKGFHKTLATETAKIKDVEINITPNMKGFHEKVRAGTARLKGTEVKVDAVINTTQADAQVGAFATAMRAKLNAAIRSIADFRFGADSSEVDREIASIRAKLVTLQNQSIRPDFDSRAAMTQINALEARLKILAAMSPNIKARFDIGQSAAGLASFIKQADDADRSAGRLTRTSRGLSGVFGGIASGVGSAVSGLGNLVGAGTKAGSALVSLGASIGSSGSGLAGNVTSLGSTASTAASGLASMASTGLLVVTALGAVAAVGSVAVAGLAQVGGAAIALGSGLVPLVGLAGTLPGLLIPVGIAAGALAIAFGDEGLKGEVEKLKGAFQPLIQDVRNQLRPALTELLGAVGELAPVFQRVAPIITNALSDVARGFSTILKSSSFKSDLEALMTSSGNTIRGLGTAFQSVFLGLTDMAVAAQPAVASLVTLIQEGAAKFREFMAEGRRTGELATFFQQGVDVLRHMLDVVFNLGGLFRDFWDSASRTGAFKAALDAINVGITQFRDYVSEAGGSWDQLMAKVGPITTSIVGLVKSIGQAFVEMGAQVDVAPLIDKISESITRMTPAFVEIGQKAVPAIMKVIEVITQLVEKFGPGAATAIESFGASAEKLGPIFSAVAMVIGDVINSILIAVEGVSTAIDGIVSTAKAGWQVLKGDIDGAGQTMSDFAQRAGESGQRVKELSGLFGETGGAAAAATPPVMGLSGAIEKLPVSRSIALNVDGAAALGEAIRVGDAVKLVPESWFTKFEGDPAGLIAAASAATGGIAAVDANHLTAFTGDTNNILSQAGLANVGIANVPSAHGSTFTGDAGPVLGAAGQATGGINAVPPSHHTPITGDASSAVGESTKAAGALNGIPRPAPIPINAQDNASGVIDRVLAKLGQLVSRVWTAVVNTVTGQAGGGIVAPMATGGILPMARGDNLRSMSGRFARIVPPNTWRIIGDRVKDQEAFIPINRSAWSASILAQTASLMGKAVIPKQWLPLLRMLAPMMGMARGGVLSTDDSGKPLTWADEPAVPRSQNRPRQRGPEWSVFRLISRLLRTMVIPALSKFGDQARTAGQTALDTWNQQAGALSSLGLLRGRRSRQRSPMLGTNATVGASAARYSATGGDSGGGGWLPPGYDKVYANPGQPAAAVSDGQWRDTGRDKPGGSTFNIYPREHQSESVIAQMVARRQAFDLRCS